MAKPLLCIIDDNPMILRAMTRVLKDAYQISSGLPGVEMSGPRPDVILTDWNVGPGYGTSEERVAKWEAAGIPVVIMTGDALLPPGRWVLPKPVNRDDLHRAISEALVSREEG